MGTKIEVFAEVDDIPVRGNALASGDDAVDKEAEDEIIERLNRGDVWAWALVTVKATCEVCGAEGKSTLGACCYASEKDFVETPGYYGDMCMEALDEMRLNCACGTATAAHGEPGETCEEGGPR